jgi:hypothetical protein
MNGMEQGMSFDSGIPNICCCYCLPGYGYMTDVGKFEDESFNVVIALMTQEEDVWNPVKT